MRALSFVATVGLALAGETAQASSWTCATSPEPVSYRTHALDAGTRLCQFGEGGALFELHRERLGGGTLVWMQASDECTVERVFSLERFAVRQGDVPIVPLGFGEPRCLDQVGWCVYERPAERSEQELLEWLLGARPLDGGGLLEVALDDMIEAQQAAAPQDRHRGKQWALDWLGLDGWDPACATDHEVVLLDTPVCSDHRDLGQVKHHPVQPCHSQAMGHGSHVAGVIAATTGNGVAVSAPARAAITSYPILDAEGKGSAVKAAERLTSLAAQDPEPAFINLSWVTSCDHRFLYDAIEKFDEATTTLIAAAGNYGEDLSQKPLYPVSWSFDNVVGVGALAWEKSQALRWEGSNYGARVDVWAPGVDVISIGLASRADVERRSGTSMATALVTGALARLSGAGFSPEQARQRVMQSMRRPTSGNHQADVWLPDIGAFRCDGASPAVPSALETVGE